MTESPINDLALKRELDKVAERYRRLLWRTTLAATWLVLAVAGLAALAAARGAGYAVPGVVLVLLVVSALIVVPVLLSALRAVRDPLWVARRIEKRFPDLDARLLAALEQHPLAPDGRLGFLQQTVVAEAIEHARRYDWQTRLVPARKLRVARFAQWAGLLVLARFGKRLPGDVQLLYRDGDGQAHQLPMSKSLDDPLFAARVPSVNKEMTYSVRYGDAQTRWYKVGVFDYPDLRQADAKLKFPEYTGVPEKTVEDTRSVTAVEGTKATFTFR